GPPAPRAGHERRDDARRPVPLRPRRSGHGHRPWRLQRCEALACDLLSVDGAHLTATVVAAVRADPVRSGGLLALGTETGRRRRQRVVGTTLRGAGLRVTAFRIRHVYDVPL